MGLKKETLNAVTLEVTDLKGLEIITNNLKAEKKLSDNQKDALAHLEEVQKLLTNDVEVVTEEEVK